MPDINMQHRCALALDLDPEIAAQLLGASWRRQEKKLAATLANFGFLPTPGRVYFGGGATDAVQCVLAVQEAKARLPWLASVARDLRMLRVEDMGDLWPLLRRAERIDPGRQRG